MFFAKYSAALVVSALYPREDSKTEVTGRIVWVKVDQSLRNRLLLWSPPSVIQSVAPVFHHHRLSRQDRLGVRGEHFGTPQDIAPPHPLRPHTIGHRDTAHSELPPPLRPEPRPRSGHARAPAETAQRPEPSCPLFAGSNITARARKMKSNASGLVGRSCRLRAASVSTRLTLSAARMRMTICSWPDARSATFWSKLSDQSCAPVSVELSSTFTRNVDPNRRRLPRTT